MRYIAKQACVDVTSHRKKLDDSCQLLDAPDTNEASTDDMANT